MTEIRNVEEYINDELIDAPGGHRRRWPRFATAHTRRWPCCAPGWRSPPRVTEIRNIATMRGGGSLNVVAVTDDGGRDSQRDEHYGLIGLGWLWRSPSRVTEIRNLALHDGDALVGDWWSPTRLTEIRNFATARVYASSDRWRSPMRVTEIRNFRRCGKCGAQCELAVTDEGDRGSQPHGHRLVLDDLNAGGHR